MSEQVSNRRDIAQVLTEELSRLAERIKENHRRAGQVASGRTLRSITYEVTEDRGMLFGRFPFGTLETGRGPTRKRGNPPIRLDEIIYQWAIDKGIHVSPMPYKRKPSERWQPKYNSAEERALRSFSSAVAHKIHTKGTQLFRNQGRNDIYSNEIPDAIKRIEERIAKVFSVTIDSIHINA
jgi:hypothetical protein